MDWSFVTQGHVRAQEVVMRDEQSGQGDSSVITIKACGWPYVVFVSSV